MYWAMMGRILHFLYGINTVQLKKSRHYLRDGEERFKEALMILDYKFFLIPVMFALLRMWTCMLFLFEVYVQLKGVPPPIKIFVFYLSVNTTSSHSIKWETSGMFIV